MHRVNPWRVAVGVLLLALTLSPASAPWAQAEKPVATPQARAQQDAQGTDFYIVNNGPRTIEQIFVSPSGDRSWGRGRLSGRIISSGESQLLRENLREGCQGDVRAVFEGGEQMERRNQNLCLVNKMFFNSPAPPDQRRQALDVTIRNDSDAPIEKVYITRAGGRSWGHSWVDEGRPIAGKARQVLRIPTELGCQIDVRAIFQGEQQVEYYNENICAGPVLVFLAPHGLAARLLTGPRADPRSTGIPSDPPADPTTRSTDRNSGVTGGSGNVVVINTYRIPLRELFVSPSSKREWDRDFLPEDVLVAPNDRYAVRVDTVQDCLFDIKAIWDSDVQQILRSQNLCNGLPVSLRGPPPGEKLWTGTGFYVSRAGHLLTNKHVVYGCTAIVIARPAGAGGNIPLRVIGRDTEHDLALLQHADAASPPVTFHAPTSPLRAGEPSISLGYPIRELLGSLIVTTGIISSLSGRQGDDAQFQMQTPIQPGNSGGPVFDESGLLIGISTAQITRAGNRAVQNVNFAIKAEVALRFLEGQGVKAETAKPNIKLSPADITEQQQKSVVPLTCYN